MRQWLALAVVVVLAGLTAGLAGGQMPAAPQEPRPVSTMLQVMQGLVFPNANVIFAVQGEDPASMPREARPSVSPNPLTGLYGGWQAVENSGLALAETADLLNARGRSCANGRPVPVADADWADAVQALRESGLAVAAAARARSRGRLDEVTERMTEACSTCHRIYRARDNACVDAR